MNDVRLAQLLRDADPGAPPTRDPDAIAMSARAIRRERQRRSRTATASAAALLIVVGSIAAIAGRNSARERTGRQNAMAALRVEADQLDTEAASRMDIVRSVARSKKSPAGPSKLKLRPSRDISFELNQARERSAAIILLAADQLRDAGRADLANDRYQDLISLFPDTAAGEFARDRIEQSQNRT